MTPQRIIGQPKKRTYRDPLKVQDEPAEIEPLKLPEPKVLTAEEAKVRGYNLQPDWSLRVGNNGDGDTIVSPDKWEFRNFTYGDTGEVQDYVALSPEGKQFTRAELEAFESEQPLGVEDIKKLDEQYAELEKQWFASKDLEERRQIQSQLEEIGRQRFESPRLPEPSLEERGRKLDLESAISKLYPDMLTIYEGEESTIEDKVNQAVETLGQQSKDNQQSFVQDVISKGDRSSAETILKQFFEFEPTELEAMFPEEVEAERQLAGEPFALPADVSTVFQEALPLLVTERNRDSMLDYFFDNPDALRRSLITEGRTPQTESLVRTIYPQITEKGMSQYFSERVPGTVEGVAYEALGTLPTKNWLDRVQEVMDDPLKMIPFVASGVEIIEIGKLLQSAKDLEDGKEVSQEDLQALRDYVARATMDTTWGYEVADVIAQIIPFAGEFIATGGIFSVGKTAAVKAGEQALKRLATRTGLRILEGKLAKYGLDVAGVVAGGTLRTPVAGATRIPAATLQKQLEATLTGDEEKVWQSALKAFGEQWVEVVSESTGGLFKPLIAPVKGQLVKVGLFKAFVKANPGKSAKDVRRVFEKLGYHGVLEEMLEERVGDVGHGVLEKLGLSDQKFQIPSVKQLSVELAAFSVPGMAAKALQTTPDIFDKLTPSIKQRITDAAQFAKEQPEAGFTRLGGVPEGRPIIDNQVQTQSGRMIPVPPGIRLETARKAQIDVRKTDAWLVEQAQSEAKAKGDEFVSQQFEQMNPKKLSPADKDIMNDYLFGETNPVFTRGKVTPTAPAVETTAIPEKGKIIPEEVTPPVTEIPVTEPGQPEAGLQTGMFGEEKVVRPQGKGKVTQISMEEQLKLQQARQEADVEANIAPEPVPEGLQKAYEAQQEITATNELLQTDPVAQKKVFIGKDKKGRDLYRGLDFFISLKEQSFPEYFTLKQARMLYPGHDFTQYTQPGLPSFNKVPRDVALDDLTKEFGLEAQEIADRVMAIRQERRAVKDAEARIRTVATETPLPAVPDLTPAEVQTNWQTVGQPKLTLKQSLALSGFFGDYVMAKDTFTAFELQRELWSKTRYDRSQEFKARMQELIVTEGLEVEQAFNQATKETLAGELPRVKTDFLEGVTDELRASLFNVVYHNKELQNYPLEMASTITALTNALTGNPIPRIRGKGSILFPEGGSAWDRLNFVFGKKPKVLKAIEKMTEERESLKDVVEGVFHETGREPIPIDQETADYLRGLPLKPLYTPTVFREPIPVTQYEFPIEDAIKQMPLMPRPVMDNVIQVLKEIGMSPIDIGNFLRANKASFDFSFWRQQAPLIASHPITFVQANIEAWKALWSQKSAEASWTKITRDPLYQIYEYAAEEGGDFLRPLIIPKGTAQWRGTEEYGYLTGERLIPKLTSKLPWVKLSARAFETGTNVHNWLIFKNYHKAMLNYSEQIASGQKKLKAGDAFSMEKEMTDFAKSLANFTARGSLGKFAATAPQLSGLFFAPRAAIGRILSVRDLINANPRVRLQAWHNAASFVSTFGGIVLLGAAMGWWDVERDPRSAEYMSIRIGNTRIDPWGGYRQFLVFFTRAITQTGVSSVTGAEYKTDPLSLLQTFIRGKASPLASTILDFWRGKNFVGEEVDVSNKAQWVERVAPFAVWDIYEAYRDDPTHAAQAAIPAIVGAGVQTYTGDWKDNFPKMGLPKYTDNLQYGMTEPYYDTADFWSDTSSQFKGVDPETLTEAKGYPPYIKAIAEARVILEHLNSLPNDTLVSLGTDFTMYHQMWLDREKIVATGDEEKLKEFDQDERTRSAEKGNFTQRQFALLNQYWAITDPKKQAEFLKMNVADIGTKPRDEYLRIHPEENAELAIWGQAKVLTREAYDHFKTLAKKYDIPDNAVPELLLPPETSIDTHFTYEEYVSEGTHGGVEARLLLLKDHLDAQEAERESYLDWRNSTSQPLKIPNEPLEYYQLRVDNKSNYDDLEAISDDDSLTADQKKAASEEVRLRKVDGGTFYDVERRVEAIGMGTRENPIDEKLVNAHVELGKIIGVEGEEGIAASSAEAKLFRYDTNDPSSPYFGYDEWRTGIPKGEKLHLTSLHEALEVTGDVLDNYYVPVWRIKVTPEYKAKDTEYNAIKNPLKSEQNRLRAEWSLKPENAQYRLDSRKIKALEEHNVNTGERLPVEMVDTYVSYYEEEDKGFRNERFIVDNPTFAAKMFDITGKDIWKTRAEDIPNVAYDDITNQYKDKYDLMDTYKEPLLPGGVENPDYKDGTVEGADGLTDRQRAVKALRFDNEGKYTEFGLADLERTAHDKLRKIQTDENYNGLVTDYVGYYTIFNEGKGRNYEEINKTSEWYDDDWYLIEHPEFYQGVYKELLENQKRDFSKVPTREVFTKYLEYLKLSKAGKIRDDFRWENLDLDNWLVQKFKFVPITEQKRREALTTGEKLTLTIEDMIRRLKEHP
uniref:Uncharacterized protein n=1 Tax=viral metagenome TaxID=1070528 RepID=A0A6M3K9Z4_9ZZZZ